MKKIFQLISSFALFALVITAGAQNAYGQTTTVIKGCFPGYAYSTTSGMSCSASSTDYGCTGSNLYSTATGAVCPTPAAPTPTTTTVTVCGPGQNYNILTGGLCPATVPGFPNTGFNPVVDFVTLASAAIMLAGGITLFIVRRFAR